MNHPRNTAQLGWLTILLLGAMLTFSKAAQAQTCLTTEDMDPATKTALLTTGQRFFDMAAKGDQQPAAV